MEAGESFIGRRDRVSETDHDIVTAAVAAAETHTSGEIVTVVAGKSNDYDDVALVWASIVAFLAMSIVALFPEFYRGLYDRLTGGWGHELTANQWLGTVIAIGVLKWLGMWLILLWRPLRMALTPRSIKAERVRARAIDLFKVGTEGKTAGRTGVLLYLSLKEHRADIVADEAIAAKVTADVWGDAMAALIERVRAGRPGEGMAEAVRQMGLVLAEHFPRGSENPNELPDRLIEL
ncbi:TPM domain-containing protein [Sphingopyxis sp.]|uniref:TPM domain-containing protein n=1 Tax=Sphingopyxis sp. TaxID=1908224 RepID=UPI0025D4BBC8|nr:TPM domain-containing protein [Sphingopyxis sp.]